MAAPHSTPRSSGTKRPAKTCGCTGTRWCAGCLDPVLRQAHRMDPPTVLPAFLREAPDLAVAASAPEARIRAFDPLSQSCPACPEFEGVLLLEDFLSTEEADRLLETIEREPFRPAQSGKQKQHFGARVNFNKQRIQADSFHGLPAYAAWLEARMRVRVSIAMSDASLGSAPGDRPALTRALAAFRTTDVFVLRYRQQDRSNLDLHIDDTFAYGEAILALSLESDGVMTFVRAQGGEDPEAEAWDCVRVPLAARSLAILYGAARFEWQHAILPYDIRGRRTSITMRTLSQTLRETEVGRSILARAAPRREPTGSGDGAQPSCGGRDGSSHASGSDPAPGMP